MAARHELAAILRDGRAKRAASSDEVGWYFVLPAFVKITSQRRRRPDAV
jgi:hypothetical protein